MNPPWRRAKPAPHFALPAVAGPETVSLADYRGRAPLFLALMVGLWCPFCRRQLVQLGTLRSSSRRSGVESLAVVATDPGNARLYFKFRPTQLRAGFRPRAVRPTAPTACPSPNRRPS